MSKKMIVLALSVISAAMFALPAVASASTAHVDKIGKFSLKGPAGYLGTSGGTTVNCGETTQVSGEFLTTTSGTLQLKFGPTCTTTLFGATDHCQSTSPVGATGIIETTPLRFDLITIEKTVGVKTAGVIVTPHTVDAAGIGVLAHITCETIVGPVNFTIHGNGVIGTVTPSCGGSSATPTLDFNSPSHGVQEHTSWTGKTYTITKDNGEAGAMDTDVVLTFSDGAARKITCT